MPKLQFIRWLVGSPIAPESLKGKVVLLHRWNIGYDQGRDATGNVSAVYEKYKNKGLIAISLVSQYYDDTLLYKTALQDGITHPVAVVSTDDKFYRWWESVQSRLNSYTGLVLFDRKGNAISAPEPAGLESAVKNALSK